MKIGDYEILKLKLLSMEFYRYIIVNYASLGMDGEYTMSKIPNPSLVQETYELVKETPKGYWICYGSALFASLRSKGRWISKTSKKRFAYPTKEEALQSFIYRQKSKIRILEYEVWNSKIAMGMAESNLLNIKK